ncbi:MAG: DNA adenine methylase [Chloroflexi bacterium]|nr:DNA adenine methylase [Chloroflexota bacterium]
MRVPHPIPYQGSKRTLARSIVACFPAGVERVIEPFAGSAAVSLAAAQCSAAQHFVLNDANAPLMQLWHEIVERPQDLARRYEQMWLEQQGRERDYYEAVRADFNQDHAAHDLLYLLARCVKAAVRYNTSGAFNQSPDHRRKGTHPHRMAQQILAASRLLKDRVTLTALDYRELLPQATPRDLVYLDPPYQGVCGQRDPRYIQGVTFDAFVQILHDLNNREISYIVSYDGRTGGKSFGRPLPECLHLIQLEIDAGRSSQATLLGRASRTVESLYLSPALCRQIDLEHIIINHGFAGPTGTLANIRG